VLLRFIRECWYE